MPPRRQGLVAAPPRSPRHRQVVADLDQQRPDQVAAALVAVLDDLVQRLGDVADRVEGQGTGEAVDVAELHARLTVLRHRVNRLEERGPR